MSDGSRLDEQHRQELLAGKVLGNLSDEERSQLQQIESDPQTARDLWELEKAAAAAELVFSRESDSKLGDSLRQKILLRSHEFFPNQHAGASSPNSLSDDGKRMTGSTGEPVADTSTEGYSGPEGEPRVEIAPVPPSSKMNVPRREYVAWACCAASLLLAVFAWTSRPSEQPAEVALSPSQARSQLIESAADVLQLEWSEGTTPFDAPVDGDVVWSNSQQQGYMRFQGMPLNDPSQEQYQLWIIDPARDDQPIDGGVFDISSTEETIVSINAKLPVIDPQAFAVTIEQPGGVVVSSQERLPLLASR